MNTRRVKGGYVITWSLGLLCASFPWIFEELINSDTPITFTFMDNYHEVYFEYIQTYTFTLLLFVIDCIYSAIGRINKPNDIVILFCCVLGILTFLMLSLCSIVPPFMNAICFLVSWGFLTLLKYHWTDEKKGHSEDEVVVEVVPED